MSTKQDYTQAINTLTKYFGLYNTQDLINTIAISNVIGDSQAIGATSGSSPPRETPVSTLVGLLLDSSTGALTTEQFINQTRSAIGSPGRGDGVEQGRQNTLQQEINKKISVVYRQNNPIPGADSRYNIDLKSILIDAQSTNPADPSKSNPGISAIAVSDIRISPAVKDVNALTIFMNSIPTIELAKCVPYLDLQFIFHQPPTNLNNRLQATSLAKFLGGARLVGSPGTVDHDLIYGNAITAPTDDNSISTYTVAGMEMFTSPQTLLNLDPNEDNMTLTANSVRDKMRPFMSIEDIAIDVVSTTGMGCYKTARLTLILHDASRLAEIADFVRPDLYGKTELLIEYGWSHSDDTDANNPYADFINGMRCKEKYNVYNTTFAMDEVGQMKITLSLTMHGASSFFTEKISSSPEVTDSQRLVEDLSRAIGELRNEIYNDHSEASGQNNNHGDSNRTQEIRVPQILDAAQDIMGHWRHTEQLQTALNNFNQMHRSSSGRHAAQIAELKTAVDNLMNNGTNNNAIRSLQRSILSEISAKIQKIKVVNDPFKIATTALTPQQIRDNAALRTGIIKANLGAQDMFQTISMNENVSLAFLLLEFIGVPLLLTHKYDDIQFIFYQFNSCAGRAKDKNIGSFNVNVAWFTEQLMSQRMGNIGRSADMTIGEFTQFIANVIIDDHAAIDYGMTSVYRHEINKENQQGTTAARATAPNNTVPDTPDIANSVDRLMSEIGTPDGVFKMPVIEMYLECVPGASIPSSSGTEPRTLNGKSILRIHVFDKQASCYDAYGALLSSSRQEFLDTVGNFVANTDEPTIAQQQVYRSIINAARTSGLIEQIGLATDRGGIHYRLKSSVNELKDFIMQGMPYIIYGINGTAVKTANLQTMQDSALASVNMQRSLRTGPPDSNGNEVGGIPLQTMPAELSLSTLGCPIANFGQQFFIDFNTGTTLDNIYGVVGLSHSIAQGKFTTDLKCAPFDIYGKYRSLINKLESSQRALDDLARQANAPSGSTGHH